MPLHVSSTCVHHQETKIALHSLWYHHTYSWPSRLVYETATCRCEVTKGCVTQFWPPHDEHMCSKHVEAWNKLIVKQKFCASSWLITEIYIYIYIYVTVKNIILKTLPWKLSSAPCWLLCCKYRCQRCEENFGRRVICPVLSSDFKEIWIS